MGVARARMTPEFEPFRCDIDRDGDRATARLVGELDMASVDRLEQALAATGKLRELVLDLSELTFIDSSGLRLLMTVSRRAREQETGLSFIPGPENIQRTFELAGLLDRMPFNGQRPTDGSSTESG